VKENVMKVFAYNIETGVRGELLDEFRCSGTSAYGMKLPKVKIINTSPEDHNFTVQGEAEDHKGNKVTARDFGRDAVIFCQGKFRAGTDEAWEWVILVTPLEG